MNKSSACATEISRFRIARVSCVAELKQERGKVRSAGGFLI
jgi:hypothetical protein